jgi:hypothetical protein
MLFIRFFRQLLRNAHVFVCPPAGHIRRGSDMDSEVTQILSGVHPPLRHRAWRPIASKIASKLIPGLRQSGSGSINQHKRVYRYLLVELPTTGLVARDNFLFPRSSGTRQAYVFSGIEDQPLCRVGF